MKITCVERDCLVYDKNGSHRLRGIGGHTDPGRGHSTIWGDDDGNEVVRDEVWRGHACAHYTPEAE